jgi:hypothetical protein
LRNTIDLLKFIRQIYRRQANDNSQKKVHEANGKRLYVNRAIGRYCHHCRTAGDPNACDAEDQGDSTGNSL